MSMDRAARWREAVRERDDRTCQVCGETAELSIIAHHKKSVTDYPLLRFELDNGVTLCRSCHMAEHNRVSPSRCCGPRVVRMVNRKYTWQPVADLLLREGR